MTRPKFLEERLFTRGSTWALASSSREQRGTSNEPRALRPLRKELQNSKKRGACDDEAAKFHGHAEFQFPKISTRCKLAQVDFLHGLGDTGRLIFRKTVFLETGNEPMCVEDDGCHRPRIPEFEEKAKESPSLGSAVISAATISSR